jgi:hypothetical protein
MTDTLERVRPRVMVCGHMDKAFMDRLKARHERERELYERLAKYPTHERQRERPGAVVAPECARRHGRSAKRWRLWRDRVGGARDAARLAAPSSMRRSAATSPAPIVPGRVLGVTAGARRTFAGETTTLASTARRRILNSRATTDASTTSPSAS